MRPAWTRPGVALDAVRIAPVVAVVIGGLRLLGLRRTARLVGVPVSLDPSVGPTGHGTGAGPVLGVSERRRASLAVVVVRRLYGDRGCLRQALVVAWILRRHQPKVRIGARRGDTVEVHAWVEVADATIGRGNGFLPLERSA